MFKKAFVPVIVLIIALFASCNIWQRYNDENDFTVVVHDKKTVEITGYTGLSKDARIPPRIGRLPVTKIGKDAFSKKGLTGVTIPGSVTYIDVMAFFDNQLTSVTIPNSVTIIEDLAFYRNELISVIISNSVTTIGIMAFAGNKLTDITIPKSVTYIGYSAFSGNNLTEIIIPNSLTSIEAFSFANNHLTSITIPEGIVSIGEGAFKNNKLTKITIPKSIVSIDQDAFGSDKSHDNNITKVTIGDNVEMKPNSFYDFSYFYSESVRKRGGTYIFDNYHWSPEDKAIPVFSFHSNYEDRNFTDISFFADMPDLEDVTLSYNDLLTDITPLSGLTNLQHLNIYSCPSIKSFAPLSSLTNLETIRIYDIPDIGSLAVLSSLPNLKNIYLGHNNKYDYRELVLLRQLENLGISFNDDKEIDMSHIGRLHSLKKFYIMGGNAEIKNITALQNLVNLEKLEIRSMSIPDISWMSGLRNLTELELDYCAINDVSPLANLPNLVNVVFHGTRVKDIAPLLNSNSIKYIRVFDDDVEAGISDDLRSRFAQRNIYLDTFRDTR